MQYLLFCPTFFVGFLDNFFCSDRIHLFLQLQLDQQATIPLANWNWTSYDDSQSHLLQGVRVSTEFINSLMWFASISNLTTYEGSARVMDTRLEGAIKEFWSNFFCRDWKIYD